jgi:hypothetical protein
LSPLSPPPRGSPPVSFSQGVASHEDECEEEAAALRAATAARRAARLPMPRARDFPSDEARHTAMAACAAAHLEPLLPRLAREALVGGARSYQQLAPAARDRQLRRALLVHLGRNGCSLQEAAKALIFIAGYARARGWTEDETWPLYRALAASLIEAEHSRATGNAA